jgi:hypothetical protein
MIQFDPGVLSNEFPVDFRPSQSLLIGMNMTQTSPNDSGTVDKHRPGDPPPAFKPTSPSLEAHRNGEAQDTIIALDILGPSNTAIFSPISVYRDDETDTRLTAIQYRGEKVGKVSLPMPHTAEEQERIRHRLSPSMENERGPYRGSFESTGVSPSPSPANPAKFTSGHCDSVQSFE